MRLFYHYTLSALLWTLAGFVLIHGLYLLADHSYQILTNTNYIFGPIGDDAFDAARIYYPILIGKKSFIKIFEPFADHRVVIERLWAMYDFVFTDGIQKIHSLRLVFFLLLTCFLESFIILKLKNILLSYKILLLGLSFGLTFFSCSLINYGSAILFTWPMVIAFSLAAFISVEKYTQAINSNQKNVLLYLSLTILFTVLAIFTFNIGCIVWPIIGFVLWRKNCLKRYKLVWTIAILASYGLFFHHYLPGSSHNLKLALHDPMTVINYLSRILSLPLYNDANINASLVTYSIFIITALTSLTVYFHLLKKSWQDYESVVFAMLSFSGIALLSIAIARSHVLAEYASIGLRFTTPSLLLFLSTFIGLGIIIANFKTKHQISLFTLISITIGLWFYYSIFGMQLSPIASQDWIDQKYFMVLASGVELDDNFINSTKPYNNEYDPKHLLLLNNTQKFYHKAAYSYYSAMMINKNINELSLKILTQKNYSLVSTLQDLRKTYNVQSLLLDIQIPQLKFANKEDTQIVFTDTNGQVIGFALLFKPVSTLKMYLNSDFPQPVWKGVVNTKLYSGPSIQAWLVNVKDKTLQKIADINV